MSIAQSVAAPAEAPPAEAPAARPVNGARPPPRPLARAADKPLWGVLFAEDFDERRRPPPPVPAEPEEPEVIEPSFTAAELEAARAEGHAQGVCAGLEQAEAAHRQAVRVALQAIAQELTDGRSQAREVVEESAAALARTLLATLRAALPGLCVRHGEAELHDILQAVLPSLAHEPRVGVQVHPDLIAAVRTEIETLGHEIANVVALTPSDVLLPGDIRIAWHHGAASRDTAAILAEIDHALGEFGLLDALPPRGQAGGRERAGRKEGLTNVG